MQLEMDTSIKGLGDVLYEKMGRSTPYSLCQSGIITQTADHSRIDEFDDLNANHDDKNS